MVPETENQNHTKADQGTAPPDEPPKAHTHSSLGRQSSIYSLTLDEFQNTFSENGKNFGSMNMDEFLSNIWTAEENQVNNEGGVNEEGLTSNQNKPKPLHRQPSLARQGSLTLPAPLCRKTVEEVWSEIHKEQQQQQQPQQSLGNEHRQATFGEMTLEDFLVKAGVVRDSGGPSSHCQPIPPPHQPLPQQYGLYQSTNSVVDPNFGMGSVGPVRPVMSIGFSDPRNPANGVAGGMPPYQTYPQSGGVVGESSTYPNGKRNGGYPQTTCFSGPVSNGGGYGSAQPLGIGSPTSPVSSDEMGANPMDSSGGQFGMDMGGLRGRKRIIDGPAEKVVERRQRRMIKNRESAARSRARKQAYTVELEAELNQLKEENAQLRRAIAEIEEMRRREMEEGLKEVMKRKPPTKANRDMEKLKVLRRTTSGPY